MQRSTLREVRAIVIAACVTSCLGGPADAEEQTPRIRRVPAPQILASRRERDHSEPATPENFERDNALTARYFDAEDLCNATYVGLGATLVAGGALAVGFSDDEVLASAGPPLLVVGGIEIVLGAIYLGLTPEFREDAQRSRATSASLWLRDQTERMRSIESSFIYFKLATGAVIVGGVALSAVGASTDEGALQGIGFGLATAASAEFGMQHVTHGVARDYLTALEGLSLRPLVVLPRASVGEPGQIGLRLDGAF